MTIDLPKAVEDSLPEPGEDGVIRCNAGLKSGKDGEWQLVELNDQPIPMKDDGTDTGEGEPPMEPDGMPSTKPAYDQLGKM